MKLPDPERLKKGRAAVICCPIKGCSVCLSACGFTAISIGEDGMPFSDPLKCVGCGGCAAVCPEGAIRLYKDRGDGTYEVTVPYPGELPELDELIAIQSINDGENVYARVIQAIPKRPRAESALVRAVVSKDVFDGGK